jgi:Skp family chaperone for outer membrane proteins
MKILLLFIATFATAQIATVNKDVLLVESNSAKSNFARILRDVSPKLDKLKTMPDGPSKEELRNEIRQYMIRHEKDSLDESATEAVIEKYKTKHHLKAIIDTSKVYPDSPIFWSDPHLDITEELKKELR